MPIFDKINNNDVHHIDKKKPQPSGEIRRLAVILSVPEVGLEPTRPQLAKGF